MRVDKLPFNVSLSTPQKEQLVQVRPVRVLDTYNASQSEFHPDGLFSLVTFGRQGSEERDLRESYIDLKTDIFHPEIYLELIKLRAFYAQLCAGKAYATWNPELKDFELSDPLNGQTGYAFFRKYWKDIEFQQSGSDIRAERIKLIEKYRNESSLRYHLVMPAGLRDVVEDPRGRVTEDEVNDLYRKLLATASTINDAPGSSDSPMYDSARFSLQKTAVQIYLYIKKMVSGKRGWVQGKWGARKTFHGTRNVITAMDLSAPYLGGLRAPKVTDTQLGLWQVLRGALPHVLHSLKNGWVGHVFQGEQEVWLTNRKTLRKELVRLETKTLEEYTTRPGLERLINRFEVNGLRNRPVVVDGYYIGLVYKDSKSFKFFSDITELPEGWNAELVKPIALGELLYCSIVPILPKLYCTVTRYPVTEAGSSYPSSVYLKTTTLTSVKKQLDTNWEIAPDALVALEYPTLAKDVQWIGAMSVAALAVKGLGADYDGDMCSAPIWMSDDAITEIKELLNSKRRYLGLNGKLEFSAAIDTVQLVVQCMTGEPRKRN